MSYSCSVVHCCTDCCVNVRGNVICFFKTSSWCIMTGCSSMMWRKGVIIKLSGQEFIQQDKELRPTWRTVPIRPWQLGKLLLHPYKAVRGKRHAAEIGLTCFQCTGLLVAEVERLEDNRHSQSILCRPALTDEWILVENWLSKMHNLAFTCTKLRWSWQNLVILVTWLVVGPLFLFFDCSGWLSAVWLTGWWVQLCSLQPCCCCCCFLGDQLQVSFRTVIHLKRFIIPEYKSVFSHGHWEGSRFRIAVKEQSLSSAYFIVTKLWLISFRLWSGENYCPGDKLCDELSQSHLRHLRVLQRNLTGRTEETAGLWLQLHVRSPRLLILFCITSMNKMSPKWTHVFPHVVTPHPLRATAFFLFAHFVFQSGLSCVLALLWAFL